jgi:phenylacetate-CoA ligase
MDYQMGNPLLSVIIPALNEENSIAFVLKDTLQAFRNLSVKGEIVVVNDGSCDGTQNIVQSFVKENRNVKLIRHDKPMGIGKAFWDGVLQSKGEYVTMLPGDNENIPEETIQYISLAKENDVIVPFVENAYVRPLFRRIISKLFTAIVNNTFGTSFQYTNGTNIYKSSNLTAISLMSKGFFYQTEILIKLALSGASFIEVPYLLSTKKPNKTKAISLKSFCRVIIDYIGLVWYFIKNGKTRIIQTPGRLKCKTYFS